MVEATWLMLVLLYVVATYVVNLLDVTLQPESGNKEAKEEMSDGKESKPDADEAEKSAQKTTDTATVPESSDVSAVFPKASIHCFSSAHYGN